MCPGERCQWRRLAPRGWLHGPGAGALRVGPAAWGTAEAGITGASPGLGVMEPPILPPTPSL